MLSTICFTANDAHAVYMYASSVHFENFHLVFIFILNPFDEQLKKTRIECESKQFSRISTKPKSAVCCMVLVTGSAVNQ